jgi:hypothetical protein
LYLFPLNIFLFPCIIGMDAKSWAGLSGMELDWKWSNGTRGLSPVTFKIQLCS